VLIRFPPPPPPILTQQKTTLSSTMCAGIVLAAHGPYTAAGVTAETELDVDVVGTAFGSFHGVVSALETFYAPKEGQRLLSF
jgi:hypothetical protein